MLLSIIDQINAMVEQGKAYFLPSVVIVSSLWVTHVLNLLTGRRLNALGIYPRHPLGLPGILFSPFLHADFEHLLFNSVPLVMLIDLILSYQPYNFAQTALSITVLAGSGIWLFGRKAICIGASHVVLGFWGYLLVHAYYHPNVSTIALAAICLYYFAGSMFTSIFASEEGVSWEGHLIGLIAGIIVGADLFVLPF